MSTKLGATLTVTQMLAPTVVVVVPAGHGVAAIAPVVPTKDLSVYDEQHPLPKDAVDASRLRQLLTAASDKQIDALLPKSPELDRSVPLIGRCPAMSIVHRTGKPVLPPWSKPVS